MKKSFILVLFFSFAAFCFFYMPDANVQAEEMKTLKVGVVSAQSGPLALPGKSVLRGVEVAVNIVNTKGTIGQGPGLHVGNQTYKVELVTYDDSGDPSKSVAGFRKLSEMYKLPVIFGPFGTPQVWACQDINMNLGILFCGLSTSDKSRKRGNTLYIQERLPGLYFGDAMAEAAIKRGFKKAAVLTDINEAFMTWGKKFAAKFEALGGKVVMLESVDIKSMTDYHSIMTSIKAKDPDITFISCYEEPSALAASHALDVGYKGKFMFGSDWGVQAAKIVDMKRIAGSLVQAMNHTYFRENPKADKKGNYTAFHDLYVKIYKEEYNQQSLSIFDPTMMVFRAMEIAKSVTDAKAIRAACPKALQESKIPVIFTNNDVLNNGLMYGAVEYILEVQKDGKYKIVKEIVVPRSVLE
jgi:branched-chain amino acid transport system substrate-binding protein